MPPKLAVASITCLLAIAILGVGAVAGQISYASTSSPPASPPSLGPAPRPNAISYPPSSTPLAYPPSSQRPASSVTQPTHPPSPSPGPNPSLLLANSPSQSPLMSSNQPSYLANPRPLIYSPIPSPSSSIPPTYPPINSPGQTSYPHSTRLTSPIYPPRASPPIYPSPSLSPIAYAPSMFPTIGPSLVPPTYPSSASPGPNPLISSPPTYPLSSASPSPSPSISSPPTYFASPISSQYSSIAIPPTYPPNLSPSLSSAGPSSSISVPPTYPSSLSPSPSSAISPSSSISATPTHPPSLSPSSSPNSSPSGLIVGYYSYVCPNAETIVREAVKNAIDTNRGTGAGLIRLFFHDCFVEGCDASVLLNTTGSPTERASAPNLSLRGFEVIDAAKAALEAACPGIVSCADIVAFASRDATFFLSGNAVDFDMPAGRYDGCVSLGSEAVANLPPPSANLQQLKDMFAAKGLDTEDMVTLSGAHTIGRSRCSSFSGRLPPHVSDMNATLSATLTSQCKGGNGDSDTTTVPQDLVTPDGLDSQYYRNVLNHDVLFASDAALLASNQTADMVSANAFTPGLWETKFKAAMVKMGRAGVKTSTDGQIRKKCWMVN